MHLFFFLRGKFEQVEQWKCLAQGAFWKWRRINLKTNQEETILVQGALRPSVFGAYEYIFPKEALAEVCSFFGITKNEQYGFNGLALYARHFCLRKIFGCRKIPKSILYKSKTIPPTFSTEEFERGCGNCVVGGVPVHVIGIKDDAIINMNGYKQEGL